MRKGVRKFNNFVPAPLTCRFWLLQNACILTDLAVGDHLHLCTFKTPIFTPLKI